MILFYIKTVIIWFLIIIATGIVFRDSIIANGWNKNTKQVALRKSVVVILAAAMIPGIRVLLVAGFIYMALKENQNV